MAISVTRPGGLEETRIRTSRTEISVAAGATEEKTVTFSPAFANAAYTVIAQIESTEGAMGSSLRLRKITEHLAGSVSISVTNDDGLNALSGTIHCLAVHD